MSAPIKASGYILLSTSKHVLISSLVLQATLAVTYSYLPRTNIKKTTVIIIPNYMGTLCSVLHSLVCYTVIPHVLSQSDVSIGCWTTVYQRFSVQPTREREQLRAASFIITPAQSLCSQVRDYLAVPSTENSSALGTRFPALTTTEVISPACFLLRGRSVGGCCFCRSALREGLSAYAREWETDSFLGIWSWWRGEELALLELYQRFARKVWLWKEWLFDSV